MRSRALIFAALGSLLFVGTVLVVLRYRPRGAGPAVASDSRLAQDTEPAAEPEPEPDAGTNAEREPARSTPALNLIGRVRSTAGDPIAGAAVTLSVPATADAHCEPVWRETDWGPLERADVGTTTDAKGAFTLELNSVEPIHGVVIWASHPDFVAGELTLRPDRAAWPATLEIVLEAGRPMHVSVVGSSGQPIPGAKVEQFGVAGSPSDNTATTIGPERARRLFRRAYTTAGDGTVVIPALAHEQVLVARQGNEATMPWRGLWQEKVVLTLLPTFEVGGTVTLPRISDDQDRERRIVIAGQVRNLWRDLASIREVEAGPWGPVTIPLIGAQRYRARLEGAPIVPAEVFFPPPLPGSSLSKDLVAEIGDELWFKVVDEHDDVIPTARVKVLWPDPDQPNALRHAEASKTRQDQIGIVSVPRGSFYYEAWAPGFAWVRHGPFETSAYQTAYLRTELPKAGLLRGKVLHRAQPVQDFEILVWQPAGDRRPRAEAFFGRADGTFELDSMPAGEFWMTANSASTPACEPLVVTCSSGGVTEVTLELLDGLPGRGRVIDAETRLPLMEASVQLFVRGDVSPAARWGQPVPVEADGGFEVGGFLPGQNFIRALADGYSSRVVAKTVDEESILEWGEIVLSRAQDFLVRVDPPERAAGARVTTKGQAEFPPTPFSADGTAIFPSANAGNYGVTLTEADGSETFVEVDLVPGEDWVLRTRLAGRNELSVEVVEDGRDALARVEWIEVIHRSSEGRRTIRKKFPSGAGSVVFEGVDAERVNVMVVCRDGSATTVTAPLDGPRSTVEVVLRGQPFHLRVVDPEGEPLSDVRVILADSELPAFVFVGGTDERGLCSLQGVPEKDVRVSLQHGTLGSLLEVPVDARERSVELVLEARAHIELAFLDGTTPLAGVSCDLNRYVEADSLSDAQGHVAFHGIGAMEYALRATRPDCWPVEFTAAATTEGLLQTIQMRRLGDLELQVLTAEGVPIRGLPVRLLALELDADVEAWIREGRVPPADLVTDSMGEIRVARMPRGPYQWRAEGPSGPVEGALVVEPARSSRVRLALP